MATLGPTLHTLGYTIIIGSFVSAICMVLFGFAVRFRHHGIAPRCTARPKDTIYNPNPVGRECQNRGGPMFGWIGWTLSLSFDTMLKGIPGTGTREGGMEGTMLTVNLDSIILIRFHDLCLKVCCLTSFLCLCIVLPLNWTAGNFANIEPKSKGCATDYCNTTIAHIPPLEITSFQESIFGDPVDRLNLIRLYLIVACSWMVTCYTIYLIGEEWREALALRRAYYLEADHYMNRKNELESTSYFEENSNYDEVEENLENLSKENGPFFETVKKKKKELSSRDLWIPHPEQRETVPNIELYSVLVENLPSLPSDVVDKCDEDDFVGFTKRESMDWQLAVAGAFFDHAVPNQPGFSSSVAAITILPTALELAMAWRKWYKAAAALRRLRFVRTLISERRRYDIETDEDENVSALPNAKSYNQVEVAINYPSKVRRESIKEEKRAQYFREVFGSKDNEEVENDFFQNFNFGPEQTAMYSREFAQGAASCCPNGCGEGAVRSLEFQELLDLEKDAEEAVYDANVVLNTAQKKVAVLDEKKVNTTSTFEVKQSYNESVVDEYNVVKVGSGSIFKHAIADKLPKKLEVESDLFSRISRSPNVSIGADIANSSSHSYDNAMKGNLECKPVGKNKPDIDRLDNAASYYKRQTRKENDASEIDLATRSSNASFEVVRVHSSFSDVKDVPIVENDPPTLKNESPKIRRDLKKSVTVNLNPGGKFSLRHLDVECQDAFEKEALSGKLSTHKNFFKSPSLHHSVDNNRTYPLNNLDDSSECSIRSLFPLSTQSHPRKRLKSDSTTYSAGTNGPTSEQWRQYEKIRENDSVTSSYIENQRKLSDGEYEDPKEEAGMNKPYSGVWSSSLIIAELKKVLSVIVMAFKKTFIMKKAVNSLRRENTVAVVTFTSRQAAVAARTCLSDGRGSRLWVADSTIPVAPLADAASCDLCTCRACCRPVTVSIPKNEKLIRKCIAMAVLITLFIFYILPITIVTGLIPRETKLTDVLPFLQDMENNLIFSTFLNGVVQGLLLTVFFSLAPLIFKMIANFGSNANSVITAERSAMKYYWWFMVVTAFAGNNIFTATQKVIVDKIFFYDQFIKVFETIADSVPVEVSSIWLNWIILRTTMILPIQYLLQINTFIFYSLGWKCCARCVMGGGPGGQTPYRIYIDSGVVFMCNVSLSFASPLVAPCALVYFLLCGPLWRRNSIYLYRPKFDGGGIRWPFLSEELISGLIVGQIILTIIMSLKEAVGPAVMAALAMLPTVLYRNGYRHRYLQAYLDAALLQTSLLDGWDNSIPSSMEKREDFRRFLVDAHKAAYIPVCIAGSTSTTLTAELAVVIPKEGDVKPMHVESFDDEGFHDTMPTFSTSIYSQHGASVRRITPMTYMPSEHRGQFEIDVDV